MMKPKIIATAAITGLVVLFSLGQALADLYFENEQISQGIPGKNPATTIVKNYIRADATMVDMADRITIIDLKEKMLYDMDKKTKTYRKTEVEKAGMPGADTEGIDEEEKQMMQAMMKAMAQGIKVTPTDEIKTISGYKCRKYIVTIMMTASDYWVTKDIQGYDEMKAVAEKTSKLLSANPMMKQMNTMGMMKELDGFVVQTYTQMMGGTITSTLKKVEQKPLDKNLFKVPAGYKLDENGE